MYYKFFFNSVLLVPNYTKFSFFTSIHSVCVVTATKGAN